MKNFLFSNLSIHKIGIIGANLAAITIVIFAIVIINQERIEYEKEIAKFESNQSKEYILEKKKIEYKKTDEVYNRYSWSYSIYVFYNFCHL